MECLLKCGGKKTAHWFPQRRPFQCFFPIGKTPRGSEGQSRSFNLKADFWIEKVGVEDDFAAKLWAIPSHITFFFRGKKPGIYPESLLDIYFQLRGTKNTMTSS